MSRIPGIGTRCSRPRAVAAVIGHFTRGPNDGGRARLGPGQPTDFNVELNPDGSITLKWKAKHPEGFDRVVYFVQRKLAGETAFRLVGGSGEKSYQDDTLPVGIDGAPYIVTAQRGNVQGQPSRQLFVTFGSGGPGMMTMRFAEADGRAKKAA